MKKHWFLLLLLLSANAWSHGDDSGHSHDETPVASIGNGLARLPDGSVNVPKLAQRRMGIRTAITAVGGHPVTVMLNGKVVVDPNASGRVQAPFAGRVMPVDKNLPVPGQHVRKGEALVQVQGTASAFERANQQSQYADVKAKRSVAEQRVARLHQLEGSVPQKDIEAADAELRALQQQELAFGSSLGGSEKLNAPVSGVIASANAQAGQMVEARDLLYEIVDPQRLMIEAYSPDASLAARVVEARLMNVEGVELQFVGAGLNLKEGALPLSFKLRSGHSLLALGQPVTLVVATKENLQGVALPATAVVRNANNESIVWLKAGMERFKAQPVKAQPIDAATVVVTEGLQATQRVVTLGASLLNQIR